MGEALGRVGAFCAQFRWAVLAIWLVLVVGLTALTGILGPTTNNSVSLPGTESQAATDLLTQEFPPQQNGTSPAVYYAAKGKVDDGGKNQKAITDAYKALKKQDGVNSVTNPFEQPAAGFVSKDGKYAFIPILLDLDSQQLTEEIAEELYETATTGPQGVGLEAAVGGPIGSVLSQPDTGNSEKLGVIAAGIILTISFGSLVAMGMPLMSAVFGLLLGLSGIWVLGTVVDTPSIGVTIARMIGLGVGIDYALFLVTRYRSYVLGDGLDPKVAAGRAVATSGGAIIFAGSTVVIALVSLQVAGIPFIAALGLAAAVAVVGAVLAAVTLLPAVLAIIGGGIGALRLPFVGRRTDHPIATRWATLVTRRPWASALVAALLLIPLAIPVTSMTLGQEDLSVSPPGTSERDAYDLMSDGFGPGYNGPLLVAVSIKPKATPSDKYEKQYNEAESLKASLDQAQQTLPAEQAALEAQEALLEEQEAALLVRLAALEAEAGTLANAEKKLAQQARQLTKEKQQLKAERQQIVADVAALAAETDGAALNEIKLGTRLGFNVVEQAFIDNVLSQPDDPAAIQALERELAQAQQREAELRQEISALEQRLSPEGQAIFVKEKRLITRAVENELDIKKLEVAIARTSDPAIKRLLDRALTEAKQRQQRIEQKLQRNLAQLSPADQVTLTEIRRTFRQLAVNDLRQRELNLRIDAATDPVVRAALQRELAQLQQSEVELRAELRANSQQLEQLAKQASVLRGEIRQLELGAKALAKSAAGLAAAEKELLSEAAQLAAAGRELAQEKAALEAAAAALEQSADELEAELQQAQAEQAQAEKLQKKLTKELTAAGGDARGTDPRIVKLQTALAEPSDVDLVSPPQINDAGTALTMSVIAKSRPAAPETADLVEQERTEVIPSALSPGMTADVGGTTAANIDLAAMITAKMLLVILTVTILSSILLLIAFRSLLIPLQAAVANLLAACAAFGLVTVIFQWGWGLDAIGLPSAYGTVPVVSYVPLMMFAALFGLSMDYQVFMMSTIQGEHASGKSARAAVKAGVAGAAKVIVTAALIMMSVFGSFVINPDPVVKQFGIGLTAAVAFAAFLVLLLAPAALTLFNRGTWWLPGFLDRILPDLDLEGRALERKLAEQSEATDANAVNADSAGQGESG